MRRLARILPTLTLMVICHGLTPATLHAQHLDWKLEDFKPVTELPWGGHDAGATARFGFAQLEKYGWYGHPKDEVIDFFAGKNNEYRDNTSVIDRTFCSARVWAATKPAEMKAWVATLKDDKLREALTWLVDHPWGPGRF
ncbi:hypothetical protein DES53_1087 [Roseimicrobium gellanilyticum]|uniref:Uncharacterized protein n=1 Tax=Roseimicrobium gellanilyticum TaxID=748857 RepID=A0A366HCW2_9BACT|nr:hypothetical protein [Roseimicrobium gellanilyticum]RBP40301.1 hypothetical protein DES53_1087 [Roseimicrobium gellanilyticum]